jgi:drug/metabolite transporter (DMT)-like permease
VTLALGLALALASAVAFNWAWIAQHTAASSVPPLTVRRPIASLRLLFAHRAWLVGFVVGIGGWVLYVVALALAPLSLVQAVSAGGVGLMAVFAQRASGEPLPRREWAGVAVAVAGLVLLAISLRGGSSHGHAPSAFAAAAWLLVSVVCAGLFTGPVAPLLVSGAGFGLAAGTMYAAGDVATKAAVRGGAWLAFVPALLACHGLAFVILQLGFQRGRALATAGLNALLTNALPIAAGVVLFHEGVPGGADGVLRLAAFACVVAGAAVLARPERPRDADDGEPAVPYASSAGRPSIDAALRSRT